MPSVVCKPCNPCNVAHSPVRKQNYVSAMSIPTTLSPISMYNTTTTLCPENKLQVPHAFNERMPTTLCPINTPRVTNAFDAAFNAEAGEKWFSDTCGKGVLGCCEKMPNLDVGGHLPSGLGTSGGTVDGGHSPSVKQSLDERYFRRINQFDNKEVLGRKGESISCQRSGRLRQNSIS